MPTFPYHTKKRSSLFFSQWEWSVCFYLKGSYLTRELTQEHLHKPHSPYWTRNITLADMENLSAWVDFINQYTGGFRRVLSWNWQYIYTNDTNLVDELANQVAFLERKPHVVRAHVCLPQNVISCRYPKHKFRTYLREKRLSRDTLFALRDYIANQPHLQASPGLLSKFERTELNQISGGLTDVWTYRYHFVDHDHEQDLMLLNLIVPGITRKSVPIQADTDK